jgi:hypothetical protein
MLPSIDKNPPLLGDNEAILAKMVALDTGGTR